MVILLLLCLQDNLICFSRPQNHQELFNLCLGQLCNVVEHIFGIFKHQFGLTLVAPEYSIADQAMFIPALGALHNFICIHDPVTDDASHVEALPPQKSHHPQGRA